VKKGKKLIGDVIFRINALFKVIIVGCWPPMTLPVSKNLVTLLAHTNAQTYENINR